MSPAAGAGLMGMSFLTTTHHAPRVLEVPPAVADVLDSDEAERRFFERLSYGEQRRYIRRIERVRMLRRTQ